MLCQGAPLLTAKSLKAIALQNPLSSLADDVKAVKRTLSLQVRPVVLVGHSWGGAVITEAGNHPQVAGLVYVAAGAPNSGESFSDWWKDYIPMPGGVEIKPYGKDGYVALTQLGVRQDFAQDLSKEEADVVYAVQVPLAARCCELTLRISARSILQDRKSVSNERSAEMINTQYRAWTT
jgi:pimeloyl-ACP methyl ester carboxylesterase